MVLSKGYFIQIIFEIYGGNHSSKCALFLYRKYWRIAQLTPPQFRRILAKMTLNEA